MLCSSARLLLSTFSCDLPQAWTHHNEGGGTLTVFDVVGHLIHAENTDWLPRANMILEYGESRAFEPFDRGGHAKEIQGKSLPQLLDEFTSVRSENLGKLHALNPGPADLARRGRHPALGIVTLAQLLAVSALADFTLMPLFRRLRSLPPLNEAAHP